MEGNKNKVTLFKLYFTYALQRSTLIILLVSLICLSGMLIFVCNPKIDMDLYYTNYAATHIQYINNAIFYIEQFNSIIISALVITLAINSKQFDVLFISDIKRKSICIIKLLTVFTLLLFLVVIEVIIAIAIPMVIYPNFKLVWTDALLIPMILLVALIEVAVGFGIVTIIQNQFLAPIISFFFIGGRMLCNSMSIVYDKVKYFLPIIVYNTKGPSVESYIAPFLIIFMFVIVYFTSYTIKDIK